MQLRNGPDANDVLTASIALRISTKLGAGIDEYKLIHDPYVHKMERPFVAKRHDGARLSTVCWHGYLAFLMRLYIRFPKMDVKTMTATYASMYDFRAQVLNDERIMPNERCFCNQSDIDAALEGEMSAYIRARRKERNNVLRTP